MQKQNKNNGEKLNGKYALLVYNSCQGAGLLINTNILRSDSGSLSSVVTNSTYQLDRC